VLGFVTQIGTDVTRKCWLLRSQNRLNLDSRRIVLFFYQISQCLRATAAVLEKPKNAGDVRITENSLYMR
jgi:hypothetical protein